MDSGYGRSGMGFSAGVAVAEVRHLHLNASGLPVGRQGCTRNEARTYRGGAGRVGRRSQNAEAL